MTKPATPEPLAGAVEVRTRYLPGAWASGFAVVDCCPGGVKLQRLSDQVVLPDVFPVSDVRPVREPPSPHG